MFVTATKISGLRWLRMPDAAESFDVAGEPFVCIGIHRKAVSGGTLESQIYQPAVMVRDVKGTDFLMSLSKPGLVEVFEPAVLKNGGRWEGIGFTAQGSRVDDSYRAVFQVVAPSNGNGNGAQHG